MTSHYAPWDGFDDDRAVCGHRMTEDDTHAVIPTCPSCTEALLTEEARIADWQVPLDADEAARELDPLLNAGIPDAVPQQPSLFGADLFAYAVSLNRVYAAAVRRIA